MVFALKRFRLNLLSTESFKLITDHQALFGAFRKHEIHGLQVRCLYHLVEYDFDIAYMPAYKNSATDFLWLY